MVRDTKTANKGCGEKSQIKESHQRRDTVCRMKPEYELSCILYRKKSGNRFVYFSLISNAQLRNCCIYTEIGNISKLVVIGLRHS